MEDIDHRSLVVEFADYLVLIEAAVGSANGERMVDAVKRRWLEKPIRYFFFSHHHPHYTGGLRAFIAEGATIITTPGNKEFVRKVARYRFKISPDRLARSPRPVRIHTFRNRFELTDSTNRLVAIDIGERSTHTDEFVIFYLPKQKLVFEAEQGWVTVDGALLASRRAEGFLKVLSDEGIDAQRLVQCWPMRANKPEVSRSELEALVRERKK
jgi:glyoxylase-like metal-dependent hydrolase (beta-lactamase superfamily II)